MSAIFGRYQFDDSPVAPSTLRSMQEAMAYWGPDGDGLWSEGPVGLGCLQRNNTPESVGESLPWVCPDTGDVITASARIDNRDELFESLSVPAPERAGSPRSSTCGIRRSSLPPHTGACRTASTRPSFWHPSAS